LELEIEGERAHLIIPESLREGHEEHFARVAAAFLGYVRDPKSLPAWEQSNMLVKYYICTKSVDLARGG
jgi:hypothetical protein